MSTATRREMKIFDFITNRRSETVRQFLLAVDDKNKMHFGWEQRHAIEDAPDRPLDTIAFQMAKDLGLDVKPSTTYRQAASMYATYARRQKKAIGGIGTNSLGQILTGMA